MGIHVHEFMSLDGVIDAPVWTFEYGFHAKMGEAIGSVTGKTAPAVLDEAAPRRHALNRSNQRGADGRGPEPSVSDGSGPGDRVGARC